MTFSLLCPTRNRVHFVEQLFYNLEQSIAKPDNVELILMSDYDDKATYDLFQKQPTQKFQITYIRQDRSEYLNKDYYNYAATKAQGDYLWAIGDDVRFLTYFWDMKLTEKIEEILKPDRIGYFSVTEEGSQAKHPCFPIITKESFQALKIYFHPQLMSWGADRTLYEVYSANSIRRCFHIPDVSINHLSYHDKKAVCDDTAKSMKERFFRDPECHNKVSMYQVPQHIKILERYINERVVEPI